MVRDSFAARSLGTLHGRIKEVRLPALRIMYRKSADMRHRRAY
jgi:hypothetical protein